MEKEVLLFDNKWVQVKQKGHYVFAHHPWCNGMGVAILPYRYTQKVRSPFAGEVSFAHSKKEYLLVSEICPAHGDEAKLGAITGGFDKEGEDYLACALRELEEEGGYKVDASRVTPLGKVHPTKGTSSVLYLFGVEINGEDVSFEPTLDGTIGEESLQPIWVSESEAVYSEDPMVSTMILRLQTL